MFATKYCLAILAALIASVAYIPAARSATAVFKCTTADGGVVFSPNPCGKNAKEVDTSHAQMRGTAPNLEGVSDRAAMANIDGVCTRRLNAINGRYNNELAGVDAEGARLNRELSLSMNNYAGATRDNGIRSQLAALEERRGRIAAGRNEEQRALAKECDDSRATEQARQAKRDEDRAAKTP